MLDDRNVIALLRLQRMLFEITHCTQMKSARARARTLVLAYVAAALCGEARVINPNTTLSAFRLATVSERKKGESSSHRCREEARMPFFNHFADGFDPRAQPNEANSSE